jgi:hypothetical protein
MANTEAIDLIVDAEDRLRREIPIFRSFMNEVAPALGRRDSVDNHLIAAGAGLLHIVTKGSLVIEDSKFIEDSHPELADLEAIFFEIENE